VETIYTVMRAYRRLPYSGRVILFKATETSALPYGFHESPEIEWKRLVGHGLEIERLPCDHATILKNPYVAQIARRVRAAIDRAVERDRRTREEVREPAEHSAEAVASE
jgi:thioesterase domain-containing protein